MRNTYTLRLAKAIVFTIMHAQKASIGHILPPQARRKRLGGRAVI